MNSVMQLYYACLDLGLPAAKNVFSLSLSQAATFWRCVNTAENDSKADDPGALAAVGCLRAIGTILESVSRLPHLYVQIEPTLLPIMRRMLTTDGQGMLLTA